MKFNNLQNPIGPKNGSISVLKNNSDRTFDCLKEMDI